MKVTDPAGQTWRVSRRWVPWRRRVRDLPDAPEVPGGLLDDPVGLVIGIVLVVICVPFVLVGLIAGLEFLLLLLVLPFALLGRVALGRHWHVELRRGFTPWWEVEAGDWRESDIRIHEIADSVRKGEIPARSLGV